MKIVNMDHMRAVFEDMCSNEVLRKQMNEFFDSEPEVSYRDIFDDLSLEEISNVTKIALSAIYRKLRNEECFGYNQHCLVTSMGSNEYSIDACIIDGENGHYTGTSYENIYWL